MIRRIRVLAVAIVLAAPLFGMLGNHVVGIQHSLSTNGPWTTIGYAKVSAAGRVTLNKSAPAARLLPRVLRRLGFLLRLIQRGCTRVMRQWP